MRRAEHPRQLDQDGWHRVEKIVCARLAPTAGQRSPPTLVARDLAIVMLLGACGLRDEEVRMLPAYAAF